MTQTESHHQSKEKFLDTALQVISASGYATTRMEDIIEAACLTKDSLLHHVKCKEELGLAVADHFAAMADRAFASAPYQHAADPLDRLLGYVDFRAAILQGELPDVTCLLGTMVQEAYDTNPAIRSVCEKHIGAHAAAVSRDIAEAKRRYAPNAPWTPESLGLFTQAVLQGAFVLAKAKGGPEIAGECLSHLRRYLVAQFGRPVDQAGRRGPKRPPKSTNAEKNKGARRRQAP